MTEKLNPATALFMSVFLAIYLPMLVAKTIRKSIDLYDLFLLSMVAVGPSSFLFFPAQTIKLSHLLGVHFPFVLLFGFLFFVVFLFLHRSVVTSKAHERRIVSLVQEVGLLTREMREMQTKSGKPLNQFANPYDTISESPSKENSLGTAKNKSRLNLEV